MYSEELKSYLLSTPGVKCVYFDSEGNHYFIKKDGRKEVGRDEILGQPKQEEKVTKPKKDK